MSKGIKFTNREMRHIALFESITGATVRDCIIDDDSDRIIFVIKEGDVGIAIGRRGKNVSTLEKMTGKMPVLLKRVHTPRSIGNHPCRIRAQPGNERRGCAPRCSGSCGKHPVFSAGTNQCLYILGFLGVLVTLWLIFLLFGFESV